MKKQKSATLPLLFGLMTSLTMALPVLAGEKIGNGGGGWICRNLDSTLSIRWVRLIDLYEAEIEFGLRTVTFENGNFFEVARTLLLERLAPIAPRLHGEVASNLLRIFEHLSPVEAELEVIPDADYRIRPRAQDCAGGKLEYAQIANNTLYGSTLLDRDIIASEKFSDADFAALLAHEAIYATFRERFGDLNSVRTRRLVGLLFSRLSEDQLRSEALKLLGSELN